MHQAIYVSPDIASGGYNVREGSRQSHEVQIRLYSQSGQFSLIT